MTVARSAGCYNTFSRLPPPAGVIFQRHHYLSAHPAAVRGQPGDGGAGPGAGVGSDSAERAARQPGDLPHPGPDCLCDRTDPVADLPGELQGECVCVEAKNIYVSISANIHPVSYFLFFLTDIFNTGANMRPEFCLRKEFSCQYLI